MHSKMHSLKNSFKFQLFTEINISIYKVNDNVETGEEDTQSLKQNHYDLNPSTT